MAFWNKGRKGIQCEDNPDGTKHCMVVTKDKEGNVFASGSEFDIGTDSNCKPTFNGRYRVFDEDKEFVDEAVGKMSLGCKKGL